MAYSAGRWLSSFSVKVPKKQSYNFPILPSKKNLTLPYAAQERDWKRITAAIARAREVHFKWEVLVDWQFKVQTARYERELF